MKHSLFSLLLCAMMAIPASAQSYDYLTFQKQDGTEISLTSTHLKMTFVGNILQVSNGTDSYTAPLSEMKQMFFSAQPTGVWSASMMDNMLKAEIVGGHLITNAPVGSRVSILALDGRLLSADAYLVKGTYLVRINNTTLKVVAQ